MLRAARLTRWISLILALVMLQCGSPTYITVRVVEDGPFAAAPDTLVFRVSDANQVLVDDAVTLAGDTTLPLDILLEPGPDTLAELSLQAIVLADSEIVGEGAITATWMEGELNEVMLLVSPP